MIANHNVATGTSGGATSTAGPMQDGNDATAKRMRKRGARHGA
jgi:hypothetical protein